MVDTAVLVAFVDALGLSQVAHLGALSDELSAQSLSGILGYSSGALPTILTGAAPDVHGRMCTFQRRTSAEAGVLAPLSLLGLLPRVLHERRTVRRWAAAWLRGRAGLTGYVDLYRIPPREFAWLDLPEREDLFQAPTVGGAPTFLTQARRAGLRVYADAWQLPAEERARTATAALRHGADLAFLYAPELDGVLHRDGCESPAAARVGRTIAERIARARDALGAGGRRVVTLIVGDHGMANVRAHVDPGPALAVAPRQGAFVDSTMLRVWASPAELDRLRALTARHKWPGRWLDEAELAARQLPGDARFGRAIFVLEEGTIFVPSFVGGAPRGMHGYDLSAPSSRAAFLTDASGPTVSRLSDVADVVLGQLGLQGSRAAAVTGSAA